MRRRSNAIYDDIVFAPSPAAKSVHGCRCTPTVYYYCAIRFAENHSYRHVYFYKMLYVSSAAVYILLYIYRTMFLSVVIRRAPADYSCDLPYGLHHTCTHAHVGHTHYVIYCINSKLRVIITRPKVKDKLNRFLTFQLNKLIQFLIYLTT